MENIGKLINRLVATFTIIGVLLTIEDGGVLGGDQELAQNGYSKLSYLQRDCDVTVGDLIVTSGLGQIYPRDLIIGEVIEIRAESQDISLYAVIDPSADVLGCTDVFVVTYFPSQGTVVNGEIVIVPPSSSDAE